MLEKIHRYISGRSIYKRVNTYYHSLFKSFQSRASRSDMFVIRGQRRISTMSCFVGLYPMERKFFSERAGGFTSLEFLLCIVIISSITLLAWPQLGNTIKLEKRRHYEYAISQMATQAWREAQIQKKPMHIVFHARSSTVRWQEGEISIPFPERFTMDSTIVWLFPPDGYPDNPKVFYTDGSDSLVVSCIMNARKGQVYDPP